jgi:bifunctional DNA-binding transcriptional regulator/antitoxin component of YhaV-PrlF toxin-antitoxin module
MQDCGVYECREASARPRKTLLGLAEYRLLKGDRPLLTGHTADPTTVGSGPKAHRTPCFCLAQAPKSLFVEPLNQGPRRFRGLSRHPRPPLRDCGAIPLRYGKGVARISSKHQVTLPVESLKQAGFSIGDEVAIEAEGADRIVVRRVAREAERVLGVFDGLYEPGYLERLRSSERA